MKNGLVAAPLLLAAFASAPTHAAIDSQTQAAPPNVEACQACHGHDGVSVNPRVPNLAGQKPDYLEAQLKAFKSKERKNDLMAAIAGQLAEDEMHGLAQYWSSLPAIPAETHAPTGPAIPSRMTFPANFPAGFTLYEKVSEDDGVTERYANAVAMRAARAGKPLPDGAVIVVVNHEGQKDASGAIVAGAVKSYSGMEARAGWGASIPTLLRNGNWDYALFDGARARRDILNQAQCLACHKPAEGDSFVFTMKALRATAAKSSG